MAKAAGEKRGRDWRGQADSIRIRVIVSRGACGRHRARTREAPRVGVGPHEYLIKVRDRMKIATSTQTWRRSSDLHTSRVSHGRGPTNRRAAPRAATGLGVTSQPATLAVRSVRVTTHRGCRISHPSVATQRRRRNLQPINVPDHRLDLRRR